MSLGLAISQVAFYLGKMEDAEQAVKKSEVDLAKAVQDKADDDTIKNLQEELAKNKILFDLFKGFHEFWKDVIKAHKELIKQINELAFSR